MDRRGSARHLTGTDLLNLHADEEKLAQWQRLVSCKVMISTLPIRKPYSVQAPLALLAIAGVLVSIAGFSGALLELVRRWSHDEDYSHGFLIPLVTASLLWTRRDALSASIGQPSFAGLSLILLAIAVHVTGELSANFILSQAALVFVLIGIVLAHGGYSLLRVAFIPIAYLIFAIPVPYVTEAILTLRLQLVSSELGVFVIKLFRIPVYLDGNIIDMGTYKLQVIEACSGLRYLYPLLSLGFLTAYLFHAPLWQRVTVFLSSVPIAIGMNGLRIGLVGFLIDRWGPQMAEGTLHFFEGWVIFLACSGLLIGEMYVLARVICRRRFFDMLHLPNVTVRSPSGRPTKSRSPIPLMACLFVLCVGGLAVLFISGRSDIIPERTRFVAFPTRIEDWQGRVSSLDLATERFLKVDDYILANYSQSDGRSVNLYVAYYASQRKGEKPHSPMICLPGGGWLITRLEHRNFVSDGTDQPFNRVVIQKDSTRDLVYYWFVERGRVVADEYWAKWYLLADAIVKNRTDGALVRLVTQINADESERDADRRLQAFMKVALPRLREFLPSNAAPPVNSALLRSSNYRS
jgi:exosortase D (VPLPA-CTERM-specific)